MASEHGNGKDPVVAAVENLGAQVHEVVAQVHEVVAQVHDVVAQVHDVVAEVHEVAAELRGLRTDTNARFESVEQVLRGQGRQLGEVVDRLAHVESGLSDLRGEVHEGFADVGQKIESAAERARHLEKSVQ